MICQSYRLCTLQMSISGHYCIRMLFSKFTECVQKLLNELIDSIRFFFQIQSYVYCYLVVSASGSVKFFAGVSDPLRKYAFYIHMDIFGFYGKFHIAFFYIFEYFLQCFVIFFIMYEGIMMGLTWLAHKQVRSYLKNKE